MRLRTLTGVWPVLAALLAALLAGWPSASTYAQGAYFNRRYTNDTTAYQSGAVRVIPDDSGFTVVGVSYNVPVVGRQATLLRLLDPDGHERRKQYFYRPGYWYNITSGSGKGLRHPAGGTLVDGTVAITGDRVRYRPMLWRFTAAGDTLWTRTYALATSSGANMGCVTADGGYALTGFAGRVGLGDQVLLLRLDSLGNVLWQRQYGPYYSNTGYAIVPTPDGGFLVSGLVRSQQHTAPYVLKVDSLGNLEWERTFGSLQTNDNTGLAIPTRDGGYAVACAPDLGLVGGGSYQLGRPTIFKLDSAGNTRWQRRAGPTRPTTVVFALHELADGALVIAGQQNDDDPAGTRPAGIGWPQGFALKVCANGDSLWWRPYKQLTGGSSHNYLRDFQPTPDGGFVGAGFLFAYAPDVGSDDSWVFRVDSVGYLAPHGPPVTASCGPLGVGQPEPAGAAVAVYPNPSADGRFTVGKLGAGAALAVCDALGRQVWRGAATGNEAMVNLSWCAPGVYVLRLTGRDGRTLTRRLLR